MFNKTFWVSCALVAALGGAHAQILIGQTAGLTGPVAAGVKETSDGAMLYIDAVNAKGGVNGQKIELVSMDDKFDPKLAAENGQKLIEEKKVLALFLTRGTPHSQALFPMLEKHGVPLIAPSTGAMVMHEPVRRTVFNVRATYQREAEKSIAYLASIGVTRIGIVHADDSFGQDALEGAQNGFKKGNFQPAVVIKAARTKPDYGQIIPELIKANVQSILWIASGTVVSDGVKALRTAGSTAQIVTLSNNASSGFIKGLGENSRGVIVSQVFPYERSIAFPFVKEARDMAKARNLPEISPAMLEGFAAAKVLVEGLRRAGPKPTRESLINALETLDKFNLGGLEVSYSPTDHTGLDFADLSIIGVSGKFRR
jgi:branched-chain amino acid transport system substrate-binding protein